MSDIHSPQGYMVFAIAGGFRFPANPADEIVDSENERIVWLLTGTDTDVPYMLGPFATAEEAEAAKDEFATRVLIEDDKEGGDQPGWQCFVFPLHTVESFFTVRPKGTP